MTHRGIRRGLSIASILLLVVGVRIFHIAFQESHRGGFPLFSLPTWSATWPWLCLLLFILAIILFPVIGQSSRSRRSEDKVDSSEVGPWKDKPS